MKRFLLVPLVFIFLSSIISTAQEKRVTYDIMFRYAYSFIDTTYKNNRQTLQKLTQALTNSSYKFKHIELSGSASPAGTYSYNIKLADKRLNSIIVYLNKYYSLSDTNIVKTENKKYNWDKLDTSIKIDVDSSLNKAYIAKWRQADKEIFADMRCASATLIYDEYPPLHYAKKKEMKLNYTGDYSLPAAKYSKYYRPFIALKTNMLADLGSIINIGLEISLVWLIGKYVKR